MTEKKYGLIGCPLGHSYSPQIHKALGGYDYSLWELERDELKGFFSRRDFDGINVTIPYKIDAMGYCDRLSPQAVRIGCVNTIVKRDDGTLFGHNTDYDGFMYLMKTAGVQIKGKKALVLGTGGASKTVCTVLNDMGAGEIVTVSRSGAVSYNDLHAHTDADIIINATPVGMYPNNDGCLIEPADFPRLSFVGDVIYNPARTRLIQRAQALGIRTAGGLAMLVSQARAASQLFTGRTIPDEAVEKEITAIRRETENIVLCGMAGSGKTRVGRLLAQKLNREFVDTDELICLNAGKTPEEIILSSGEDEFRRIEKAVVAEAVKDGGRVIALGGGAVLDEESRLRIGQNSRVLWLTRALDRLAVEGRPISERDGVEALMKRRAPIYEQVSDCCVSNDGSVEEAVDKIIREVFS